MLPVIEKNSNASYPEFLFYFGGNLKYPTLQ
jgi:hypothetical protein